MLFQNERFNNFSRVITVGFYITMTKLCHTMDTREYIKWWMKSQPWTTSRPAGSCSIYETILNQGDSDVGEMFMLVALKCWWQNHYVSDFVTLVIFSIYIIVHQKISSPIRRQHRCYKFIIGCFTGNINDYAILDSIQGHFYSSSIILLRLTLNFVLITRSIKLIWPHYNPVRVWG